MKKLAAALGTVALLALPLPAISGLGPAENIKKILMRGAQKQKMIAKSNSQKMPCQSTTTTRSANQT